MTENPNEQKRSFVSDKEVPPPEKKDSPVVFIMVNGKQTPLLKPEIAPTLIYGKLCDILDEMKMLNNTFKEAKEPKTFQTVAPIQPTTGNKTEEVNPLTMPPKPTEQTPRIKEIISALEPVRDLLKIDVECSAMFVMVKPAQFLGPENFAKVAQIVRAIGGQYVSAGKNSHFEISKAPLRK
jgi:hypothetical protein